MDGVAGVEVNVDMGTPERHPRAGVELLVKWKGYSDRERTWEPLSHLENAQDAFAEWRNTQISKAGCPAKIRGKYDEDRQPKGNFAS